MTASLADLTTRLHDRAAADGLLDVSYADVDSPLGPLLAAATPAGLVRISYLEYAARDAVLEDLALRLSPRVLEAPARLDPVRRELEEYFGGRRRDFDLALDWSLIRPGFGRRVLEATAGIPYGSVLTYGQVAAEAGIASGARAAGNALGANPIPIVVPCHRIVAAGGKLGGYTGGTEKKKVLLGLERTRMAGS
jgi:methylated-DNA-[protein]-cysteine S-methyltransferase